MKPGSPRRPPRTQENGIRRLLEAGTANVTDEHCSEDPPGGSFPPRPVVAVGAVVFRDNRVLLVRRGYPPSEDLWAIPGGKVCLGVTLQAASEREVLEDTGLVIRALEPVYTFDHIEWDEGGRIRFHYVIVDLRAEYLGGRIRCGDDAREARWISETEIENLSVSARTRELLRRQFQFG